MSEDLSENERSQVHPVGEALVEAVVRRADGMAVVERDDRIGWLEVQYVPEELGFIEIERELLSLVPFRGERAALDSAPWVEIIRPAWVVGELELVVRLDEIQTQTHRDELEALMQSALDYWVQGNEQKERIDTAGSVVEPEVDWFDSDEELEAVGALVDGLTAGGADTADTWHIVAGGPDTTPSSYCPVGSGASA